MLQTERLTLRKPIASDWPAYRDFMMTERAHFFSSSGDLGQVWKAFAAELGHWQMYESGMWVVTLKNDDTAIGLVGPWHPPHWPEKEIGWMMLSSAAEGKGIAAEAAKASITHAFEVLGWDTAVSYIWPDNARSLRLAKKLGAQLDKDAARPSPEALVYRHPKHEVRA